MSSYSILSLYGSKLFNNSVINISLFFSFISTSLASSIFPLYDVAISFIASDTCVKFSATSLLLFNAPFGVTGKNFEFPINSSKSIWKFFGNNSNPIDATNISLKYISSTVYPFETYASSTFPNANPIITPIFPSLLNIPASIPDIAYAAIIIGSDPVITPKVTPIVTPEVVPTKIPFFHPNAITINMLNMFLILNPTMLKSPNAPTEIASNRLAPINSSIENAFFSLKSCNTTTEFTNIL